MNPTSSVNTPEFLGALFIKQASINVENIEPENFEKVAYIVLNGALDFWRKEAKAPESEIQGMITLLALLGAEQDENIKTAGWLDNIRGAVNGAGIGYEHPDLTNAAATGDWKTLLGQGLTAGKDWISNTDNLKTTAPYVLAGLGTYAGAKYMDPEMSNMEAAGLGVAIPSLYAAGSHFGPQVASQFQQWRNSPQGQEVSNTVDKGMNSASQGVQNFIHGTHDAATKALHSNG